MPKRAQYRWRKALLANQRRRHDAIKAQRDDLRERLNTLIARGVDGTEQEYDALMAEARALDQRLSALLAELRSDE